MRVLWVENHAVFVRIAGQRFLADHDLTVVSSVAAARIALVTAVFDVVLVDHDLDDGKGTTVIELVQQLPSPIAVIAVSAHAEGNAALVAAGADAHCPKTQFADIAAVLREVVPARRA